MQNAAQQMNRFLADVEKPAYVMAHLSVRDSDDALDIVQESMMMFASKYAHKPMDQWRPLFFRIVQNKTRDFHRRATTRGRVFAVFNRFRASPDGGDDGVDVIESMHAARETEQPEARLSLDASRDATLALLEQLPERQRQAFLMRAVEGMDVKDTAQAMGCSAGSVKTHYSRAVHKLRERLQEHWS